MTTPGQQTNPTEALLAALSGFHTAKDRVALLPELERLARNADALDEVAEAVENESESVESAAVLCALLRFSARMREELGETQKATVLWNDLLAAQPVDAEALEALARLLAATRDFTHAAEVSLRRARLANPGPDRHARFVAAADLFLSAGAPDAALDALDESLSRPLVAEATSALAPLQLRRGKLLERKRPTEAVNAYMQVLAVPEFVPEATEGLRRLLGVTDARGAAAVALEPMVRRLDDPRELAELLQARSEGTGGQQLDLLLELARLRERTHEPRLALATFVRAFAIAPTEPAVRAEVERLASSLGAKDELLAAYEEWLDREPNSADLALLRRVAELHDELGNRDQALEAWEWAAEAAPRDLALLTAYADRCRQRGDLARLAKVLRLQLAASPDDATRIRLLTTLARLCEDSLADDVGAAHAYQDLADTSPNDRQLLKTLARLYEQTSNAVALAETLERDLKLAHDQPTNERVALALRLARLKLAPPEDDARALELLRDVVRLAPGNAQAVAALAQLASTPGPVQAAAAELATPALDALGDYPAIAQILEAQLANQTGQRERIATLRRICEVYAGPLKDADLAFLASTRALREAPHDPALLQRTLELGDAAQASEELDHLLNELAGAQPQGEARLRLFRSLARRLDERLAKAEREAGARKPGAPMQSEAKDEAIAAWSEVLVQAPDDAEAQGRLDDLFAQSDRLADLAVLWRQRVDAAAETERPALLLKLAAAQERAGELGDAATTLLNLFAVTRSADSLVPLERVLARSGRHLERAEALLRLAEFARQGGNERERLDRLVQQARALTLAGEQVRAMHVYAEVLKLSASEPRAVTDLVALVAEPKVRDQVAELLASVFTAPGQQKERAAVLEVLAGTPGVKRESAVRAELAVVHEQLGELTQAFAGWVRLVRENPEDSTARAEVERVALAAHFEEELVAAWEELLERTPPLSAALQQRLRAATARLYGGPLNDPELAIRTWEGLSRADRDALEPLTALEPLYRARSEWVRLGEVLERQAMLLAPDEQLECLKRLARLADGPLKNPDLAADTFRKVLQRSPADIEAVRALARLHTAAHRDAEAAAMLERQLELVDARTGPDDAADLELQVGRLVLDQLAQPNRALEHFARALQLRADEAVTKCLESLLGAEAPVRGRAAGLLEPIYRARKDSARLASALELQLPAAGAERQVVLLEELCTLREGLGELPLAFLARQELYTCRPQAEGAAHELQRLAEATGQLDELVESFTSRLKASPPDEEAIDLWRRIARARQPQGIAAADAWEQVARLAPDDPGPLASLSQLYLAAQRYGELPRLLNRRAALETSQPAKTALLLELADLAETHLNDPTTAIDACRSVLERNEHDRRALASLERLYERSARFDDLRELVLKQLEAAPSEALGLSLRVRLALIEHRFRDDDRAALELLAAVRLKQSTNPDAIAALEEVMRSQRPAAAKAAEALESHYQRGGDTGLQVEALEVRAAAAQGTERAVMLHRVADLQERLLASPANAFDVLSRLLRAQPDDARALKRVLTLAGPARCEAQLSNLLGEIAPRAAEATRPRMFRELAAVRERLGDATGMLEALLRLLDLEPDELATLERVSVLLEEAARWSELEGVLQRRLKLAVNDAQRVTTLGRLAGLYESELNLPVAAVDAWRRVLELHADDADALQRLDGLYVRLERWPDLAEVLGRRLRVSPGERAELQLRLAKVRREKLGNAAAALPLLGELLQADASHAGAHAELEQLVQDQPGWEPACDLLLGAFRRARDAEKLVVWLDTCANHAPLGAKRRALWLELSDLQLTHMANAELAFSAMARAWKESPTDLVVREKLVALANAASTHKALAGLFDEVMSQLPQPHLAEVALALAALCEQHLGQPERAATLYRSALDVPLVASRALAGLDRTLEALGRWAELLPVLETREQAAEEGPERLALLLRIAAVAGEKLAAPERSAEAYRAVLARDAYHVGAARALESLYERTGQTARLLEILERLLTLVTGAAQRQVRLKLARLCTTSDTERCVALCRQLLLDDPLHDDAFTILCERLDAGSRWGELEKALLARLQVTLVPQDAAGLAFRLAELTYRRMGRSRDAVARYRAVLQRVPGHLGALEALTEIHDATAEWRELAAVLAERAVSREEPARRRAHHVRRAEVLLTLGERDSAVAAARLGLELVDEVDHELEPILKRLRRVVLELSALPEAAQVLARLARLEAAGGRDADAVVTLLELAHVETRRANTLGATTALEQALRHEPKHRAAYDQAEALYTQAHMWAPWAALSARFIDNLTGEERLTTLDRLTTVHAEHLNDRRGAFGWVTRAVRLDPGSAARRSTAERHAGVLKTFPELATVYTEALQGQVFGPAYEGLALALAALQDAQLNQVDAAEKTLRGLLSHDPSNYGALDALTQMFERRGLHERHVQTLELKLEATVDQAARGLLLRRLAELFESRLANATQAAHALRRLFELEPTISNARLLVALQRRHQAWPDALDALLKLRAIVPREQRAQVQEEIAALHEQHLKDPDTAIVAYHEALELDPRSSDAFRALERLYLQLERPAELLRAYEHRLSQTITDAEAIELHFKSAELWEARGNPLNADQSLVALLKLDTTQLPALEGLLRLRRAGGRWRALAETLARTVQVVSEPEKLAALCTEAGQVHLEQLREPTDAERWWRQALTHVADHRAALEALAELYLTQARWEDGVKLLSRLTQLERDPAARVALEHRAGLVLEERLKDLPSARAAYQRALKDDPVHLASLRRLRGLFFQAGEWHEYEANLALEARRAPRPAERSAAAVELAAHFEKRARDATQAVSWYEHAFTARPDSLEAALPLCDLLLASERWPRANEVLKTAVTLLEREGKPRQAEHISRLCQLAQAQRRLDQPRAALESYGRALQLDPTSAGALRGQVDVLIQLGLLDEASQRLKVFDDQHGASLPRPQRAATRLERANLQWKLGRAQEAQTLAEGALELEPQNAGALRLLITACDALSSFEKAATARQRLAALATGDERHRLLLELGVIARDKLSSPTRAVDAFLEALKGKPGSTQALRQLYGTYRAVGHNRKAAETLQQLVAHPELPVSERRTDTLALADLVGRQIGEVDRAADVLLRALDEAPDFIDALRALEALLTKARDWKRLAAGYERVIRQLGDDAQTVAPRAALWGSLGEVRLRRLDDRAAAVSALEAAAELLPNDAPAQEAFADLALTFPERVGDAVQACLRALPRGGSVAKLCAASLLLADQVKDLDTGWLAARAAEVTGTANPQHRALLERLASIATTPPPFRAPVSDQGWRERLLHPLARGPIADLMAMLYEPWSRKHAQGLADFNVHPKKHVVDLRTVSHPALVDLLRVARQLGFESLDLFSPYLAPQTTSPRQPHPADRVGVKVLPTFPPSVLVGEQLLGDRDRTGLHAMCGLSLAALRPEVALALQLPAETVELLFEAALGLDHDFTSRADPKQLKAERKRLEKALSSQARADLSAIVDSLRGAKPGDFARYLDGANKTPLRVALLVAGDLAAVRNRLLPPGEEADRALRELLQFALGGELHALRLETGSTISGR